MNVFRKEEETQVVPQPQCNYLRIFHSSPGATFFLTLLSILPHSLPLFRPSVTSCSPSVYVSSDSGCITVTFLLALSLTCFYPPSHPSVRFTLAAMIPNPHVNFAIFLFNYHNFSNIFFQFHYYLTCNTPRNPCLSIAIGWYRVFIKYCVFSLRFWIFLNSASSALALVFYLPCVYTH